MMEHGSETREGKGKTILVVDDDLAVRQVLSDLFENEGYAVVSARDGESGWNEYKRVKPDLVTTDLKMPGMDGMTLLSLIRKEDSSTPVIVLTGYPSIDTAVAAISIGANDYLTKPLRVNEILLSTKEVLRRASLESGAHPFKDLASVLAEENQRLKERIEQLSKDRKGGVAREGLDEYRAICGAVAHSLKGEFLHIGHSIKELRELAGTLPDMQEECDLIERSVVYSQIFLQRLLDYLDMGKPQVEPIDTLELLRRTELLARPRLPSSIELQITIDHSIKEPMVSANFEQLMGVLVELIDNAVYVSREKGGTIELKLGGKNSQIAISVEDNGPGIPEEFKDKLLKEQVPSKNGLGLGLFLCNKVVSMLGGKLNLQTTSGKGTTFTILLPTASDEKEP